MNTITALKLALARAGARRLFAKILAANDNSKNQPYFGGDFSALNILPSGRPIASQESGHFKASLNFAWLAEDGSVHPAPHAKLILYPQYPEVRFSGYLLGSDPAHRPSELLGTTRVPGRVLFLGIRDDGMILGYVVGPDSPIARELAQLRNLETVGVFLRIPFGEVGAADTNRATLLAELCRIHTKSWIDSKRLTKDGITIACSAPNCGGYTLEAELGITPNGYAEPDFRGWEVKQHAVPSETNEIGGMITLMTPEPSDGFYVSAGVIPFVKKYGYEDLRGRADRLNFGGIHKVGERVERTRITMQLLGFDASSEKIRDPAGGIALIDDVGNEAAVWRYADLIDHWKRKHASAVYVPSMVKAGPPRQYRFSRRVRLGVGTTFELFLSALATGTIVYDPGIKVESVSTKPRTKRRSQFRIKSRDLAHLYHSLEWVNACP